MLDLLTDPFAGEIGRRALAEVLLLGLACGPLGVWVVLLRHSYAAESVAHATLPGLVVAALVGAPLLLGAAAGLVVAAAVIALAGREQRIGSDTAVAVAVTTLFGAGVILALSPEVPARLGELLFGDPLSVTGAEIAVTGALAFVVVSCLAILHRPLTLASFDPGVARSLGAKGGRAELALLLLLAGATLVAVGALGNLLAVALTVGPGASALLLAERLRLSLILAGVLAAGAGVVGLYASYYLDVAAGASIALAAIGLFGLAALVRRPLRHLRALRPRQSALRPSPR
ncbi:MAG: metal ABC transporter permease [Actinomycetota bacterium]|nr:metal ABC transporter permease [Actinomycetota bacterium]